VRKLYWRIRRRFILIREVWGEFEFMKGGTGCTYWFELTVGPLTLTAKRQLTEAEWERR
jgi:hypothetical protein